MTLSLSLSLCIMFNVNSQHLIAIYHLILASSLPSASTFLPQYEKNVRACLKKITAQKALQSLCLFFGSKSKSLQK